MQFRRASVNSVDTLHFTSGRRILVAPFLQHYGTPRDLEWKFTDHPREKRDPVVGPSCKKRSCSYFQILPPASAALRVLTNNFVGSFWCGGPQTTHGPNTCLNE